MELLFLGTSSGVPTKERNVSALALINEKNKDWFLVDCGEGTQQQLLRTKLSTQNLKGILITHVHGDHCYGLPGLLASTGLKQRTKPLVIIAPFGIKQWIDVTLATTQMYLPYEIIFVSTEELKDYELAGVCIDSTKLAHRVPSYAYTFRLETTETTLNTKALEKAGIPKGPLWGQAKKLNEITVDGEQISTRDFKDTQDLSLKIVVGGDNDTPMLLKDACKDCDLLVHESTFTNAHVEKAGNSYTHSDSLSVGKFADKVGLRNLILTHFSARYQLKPDLSPNMLDIFNEASSVFKGNLFLAEDFARYKLNFDGTIEPINK